MLPKETLFMFYIKESGRRGSKNRDSILIISQANEHTYTGQFFLSEILIYFTNFALLLYQ
jgi:hypothetical protein